MMVSEQIIQVLDVLCEKFGIAIDWAGENVMPYIETLCKKLITYEMCTSIVTLIFNLLVIIVCVIATKKSIPFFKNKIDQCTYYSEEENWTVGAVCTGCVIVISFIAAVIISIFQVEDIIKCVTFPEMYIFEYVSALINGV